jgi:hypothetical protein
VDILIRNISITAPHNALITMKTGQHFDREKEDANKDLYRIIITRSSGKN